MTETRRRFIALTGLAPIAILGARQALAQAPPVCYDATKLSMTQKNLRRAVEFVDPAPDATKRCGTCAFYGPTQGGCGTCQILSGGPTAQSAFCSSFAPKS
ncbi:MAG: high-potential iron-sulfur protein [Novosphingobium sp.]